MSIRFVAHRPLSDYERSSAENDAICSQPVKPKSVDTLHRVLWVLVSHTIKSGQSRAVEVL